MTAPKKSPPTMTLSGTQATPLEELRERLEAIRKAEGLRSGSEAVRWLILSWAPESACERASGLEALGAVLPAKSPHSGS